MKHRLLIVEGLPCSGKSCISSYIAKLLANRGKVCFFDEGTGNHPADYESHALVPAGLLSDEHQIVQLSKFSGQQLERLLPYKIYDRLPWEVEKPIMLEKWREFVREAQKDTTYVFNCVLLQNPMCETMMRFGFSEEVSREYIGRIAEIIRPMNPKVIYLKNDDIADSVHAAAEERPGWLNAVIDYHAQGAYGMRIGAKGFEGYIACLRERQEREMRILSAMNMDYVIVDNPQRNWAAARKRIRSLFEEKDVNINDRI